MNDKELALPLDAETKLRLAEIRLARTTSAAYHALLAISAWMGIPEAKRMKHIVEHMSNVKFCATHNMDEDLVMPANTNTPSTTAEGV